MQQQEKSTLEVAYDHFAFWVIVFIVFFAVPLVEAVKYL